MPPSALDDMPLGPDDKIAAAACAALASDGKNMESVAAAPDKDSTELADAVLHIDETAYLVELTEGKDGWVRLDEFHWKALMAFSAPVGTRFELMDAGFSLVFDKPTRNGACPDADLLDYRATFPEWKNAFIRFPAQDKRSIPFLIHHVDQNGI